MPSSIDIQSVSGPIKAEVTVPGSKSDTNRALIAAALADGASVLHGALFSDDTRYMMSALRTLGFPVDADEQLHTISITGLSGRIPVSEANLFLGNSGTSIRFLSAFVALGRGRYCLDGIERMRQRPIQPLLDGLAQLGTKATSEQNNGCPPVVIETNGLNGGKVRMGGEQSSQFFTALLLIGACTEQGIDIEVEGRLVSTPYIDLTASVLHRFGVSMTHEDYQRLHVPGGQSFRAQTYEVEPDASAASYFFAAAAITGGRVRINGLGRHSVQGDIHFVDVLGKMGCTVSWGDDYVEVVGPQQLRGVDIDMESISDTAPTLAAIAPFADSTVTIRGIGHVRRKETDRIAAPVTELRRLGVQVEEYPDYMVIHPAAPHAGEVETYDDHRMAMSFALIGLRVPGITILGPDCTNKTFPGFFDLLDRVTLHDEKEDIKSHTG